MNSEPWHSPDKEQQGGKTTEQLCMAYYLSAKGEFHPNITQIMVQ